MYRDNTILGSAVQHLAMNAYCPVLIIKDKNGLRSAHTNGKLRIAVCSDGSEKSIKTLNFMTRLIDRRRGDQLFVICVKTTKVEPEQVCETVNHYFSPLDEVTHGISRFVTLKLAKPGDTVDSVICEYLMNPASEEEYVDFVAVGNNGADWSAHDNKKYMGSVATGLIKKTKLNTMFFA